LYNDNILNTVIILPSVEEQREIGKFFRHLDHLITLHQRKYSRLCNVKKSMLEKMFPKDGASMPEIRFAGFTDAWEQRKVSELFRVTRGHVLAATQTETEKTDEKPYPVYSSQTKDKGLMGYYKDYLYEDAITWTTDGANAGTVNYRAGKFYCTNVCGVLLSNEVKANQMIAEVLNNVAKGYVSYVGNPKLMNNVMADIVIKIPTQAEEREQLSSFFASLDNLITLHQRELERLQNIKKACLEKMFV
jgi:type I restriction enzyme S subunit